MRVGVSSWDGGFKLRSPHLQRAGRSATYRSHTQFQVRGYPAREGMGIGAKGLGAAICWGVRTWMRGVAGQAEKMGGVCKRSHLELPLGTFRCSRGEQVEAGRVEAGRTALTSAS